jgi:hypothetical protein
VSGSNGNGNGKPVLDPEYKPGDKVLILRDRYWSGEVVKAIPPQFPMRLVLKNAAWVAQTGKDDRRHRHHWSMETGEFGEVEPHPANQEISVPIHDAEVIRWQFPLPREAVPPVEGE